MSYIPREGGGREGGERKRSKAIAKSTSKAVTKAHPSLNSFGFLLPKKSNLPSPELLEKATSRSQLHRSLLERWKIRQVQQARCREQHKERENSEASSLSKPPSGNYLQQYLHYCEYTSARSRPRLMAFCAGN